MVLEKANGVGLDDVCALLRANVAKPIVTVRSDDADLVGPMTVPLYPVVRAAFAESTVPAVTNAESVHGGRDEAAAVAPM